MRRLRHFSILSMFIGLLGCLKQKNEINSQKNQGGQDRKDQIATATDEYFYSNIFDILSKSIFTPEKNDLSKMQYLSSRTFEKNGEKYRYVVFFESLYKYNKEDFDSQQISATLSVNDPVLPGEIIANHIILRVSDLGHPISVLHQYADFYHGDYSISSDPMYNRFGNIYGFWHPRFQSNQEIELTQISEVHFDNFIGNELADKSNGIKEYQPIVFHLENDPLILQFFRPEPHRITNLLLKRKKLSDQFIGPFGRIISEQLRFKNLARSILPGAMIQSKVDKKAYLRLLIDMDFENLNWTLFSECSESTSADIKKEKFIGKLELHHNQLILKEMGSIDLDSFILRLSNMSFLGTFPKNCRPDSLESFEGPLEYQIHLESR